ncbi:hypothetical protein [Paenibacillus assamensis]|uniref:hypothetical protein n=1 Tax=Paenibacillus assamensis TaxID=311244 RepID=UPI0012F78675|nr:hypothetical protein [Paenibacillus assamensis]
MKKVLIYMLWLIGAIVFVYFGHKGVRIMSQWAQKGDFVELTIVAKVLFSALGGALLVWIGGARRKKPTNWKLFYVITMPCLLIALVPIMWMHIPLDWSWSYPLYHDEYVYYFGLVAGYSYCRALFRSQDH